MLAEIRPDEANALVMVRAHRGRKRVVIIGGGFAGIAAARALRHVDVDVVLIDRRNRRIFQSLPCQAATAIPSPAENRLRAQRQWLWSHFTGQGSSRFIPESGEWR